MWWRGCSILWGPQMAFLSWPDFQWTKPESEGANWCEVTYSRPQWTSRLTCCPGLGICFRCSVSLWWFKYDLVSRLFMECRRVEGDCVRAIYSHGRLSPIVTELTLILRRSRTGTVWFYTSNSNKRAARPKLYTKPLTRDLKLMYSRFTLVRISINI